MHVHVLMLVNRGMCVSSYACVRIPSGVILITQATLFETGSLVSTAYAWLAGLVAPRDPPVSACRVTEITDVLLHPALCGR